MRYPALIVIASIVVAFHMQDTVQGFQFSLPGQWGNNARKRTFSFSLPGQWGNGQGKRGYSGSRYQCESTDPETLQAAYNFLKMEVTRLERCMEYVSSKLQENNVGNKQLQ